MAIDTAALDSYVALGDSFTEGLEDDLGPDGRHRGWADRLAAALATANGRLRYANLAIRGRLLDQVAAEQVPVALSLRPAFVSFHAGANDVLRPRVDLDRVLRTYEETVARLRGSGAEVMVFTVISRTGTGRTADLLAARFTAANDTVRRVADQYGCVLTDLALAPALQDRRLWHEDRLHLAPAGHARVAAAALEALGLTDPSLLEGETGWWRESLPARVSHGRVHDLTADVRWARTYLLPWVGRRLRGVSSGDLLLPKRPDYVEITAG